MGVIENDFYFPNEKEITLNYECQVNWSRGYSNIYDDYSPKLKDKEGIYTDELSDLVIGIDDGYLEVRVPLLSKEHIESLGWIFHNGFWWDWKNKELDCDELSNRSIDWRLNWVNSTKSLKLYFYERNTFEWFVAFDGPCPTINHLKYIMNLFKIK